MGGKLARRYEFPAGRLTINEAATEYGLKAGTIKARLYSGQTPAQSVTAVKGRNGKLGSGELYEFAAGSFTSVSDASKKYSLCRSTINSRLRRGLSAQDSIVSTAKSSSSKVIEGDSL